MRQRNELRPTDRWPRAWLIVSEAKAEDRKWWQDHLQPDRIVVLETMPNVCMKRVANDPARPRDSTYAAISKWWQDYERRTGDEIVRG